MIAAVRQIAALVRSGDESPGVAQETIAQRAILGAGVCGLVILGIFPQALGFLSDRLPLMFLHLSR